MTQSKPSIYRQILALMGQVQLRQERLEMKLDQIKLDVTYLKSRSLVMDEGNHKVTTETENLLEPANKFSNE